LQYLPIKARYVIEALQERGKADLDELVSLTGLSAEDLTKELDELREQGMVIITKNNNKKYYKTTLS
jgi:transcription initiation factor IIE alpha subunit